MPELPEVETVRRTLVAMIVNRRVVEVRVRRASVITGERSPDALMVGRRVADVRRLGKHLAILPAGERAADRANATPVADEAGPCLAVHLGMTGSLIVEAARAANAKPQAASKHAHVIWQLDDGRQLSFDDPRRFGGIWSFPSFATMRDERWSTLGPDALDIRAEHLTTRLARSRQPIKAALLDQTLLAGVGNIYADEALFMSGIDPRIRGHRLRPDRIAALAQAIRDVLQRAVAAGGSTVRDYVDSGGNPGSFQLDHQVYGRGGEPCHQCGKALSLIRLSGRATVFCTSCQPRSKSKSSVRSTGENNHRVKRL